MVNGRFFSSCPGRAGLEAGEALAALRSRIAGLGALAIAYSGGLDSRFLCHAAMLAGSDVLAIHASGPHMAPEETAFARAWAGKTGLACLEFYFDPLSLPQVAENSRERCYWCKKSLVAAMRSILAARGETRTLCDGGNADDCHVYRPGLAAVAEAGVVSPLALAGLGKAEIRDLARLTGMEFPEQRARPCLLTRLAYGVRPDVALLSRLAGAEGELAALFQDEPAESRCDFRLRFSPAPVLHITGPRPGLAAAMRSILARYGFENCGIEVMPALSGFFDRMEN